MHGGRLIGGPLLGLAAAWLSAAPQHAADQRIAGILRLGGAPVGDAEVRWFERGETGLDWLGAPPDARGSVGADRRGAFAIPIDRPALLWIATPAGEVALVPRATPGAPLRIDLHPAATLELPDRSTGAWLAADAVQLGRLPGRQLRLPAGGYAVLVDHPDGAFVQHVSLRPGALTALATPTSHAPSIAVRRGQSVSLTTFPQQARVAAADGPIPLARSDHPLRATVRSRVAGGEARDHVWLQPGEQLGMLPTPGAWRPLRIVDSEHRPVAGAIVSAVRWLGGAREVVGVSTSDGAGCAHVRVSEATHVVVQSPNHALSGQPLGDAYADVVVPAAQTLRLRLRDAGGTEVADARVTLGAAADLVQRECYSDARGRVTVAQLPRGHAAVQVEHDRWLPLRTTLLLDLDEEFELELARGAELGGVVTLHGRPHAGVSVTVRDPSGRSALGARTTVSDTLGRFTLHGLPEGAFSVFARCDLGGRTWSGQRLDMMPGDPCEVAIECEDPPLPVGRHKTR